MYKRQSLLFAGVEFGQPDAFTDGREPNWAMLADAGHRALADYSKALNAFCHEIDHLDGHMYTELVEGELHQVSYDEDEE